MTLKSLTLISALTFAGFAHAADAPKYAAGAYQIDPAHSKVGFEIPHLVISSVEGRFNAFEGTLDLNEKFEKSKVKFSVDISSIDTGNSKRDDHLKSPDFFDAGKYPKMTFESTEVKGTPEGFKLTGNLTIHGVTKPQTFEAKYTGSAKDGYGNEKAAFTAKKEISRKEYGLTWNNMVEAGPVVGDKVTIDLKIQAAKPAAKAEKK